MVRHSQMPHTYAPSNYDDDFCLKPPVMLWLATLYFSRAFMLPVAVGIAHVAGVNAEVSTLLRALWDVELLIPSLLALPVLVSLLRRAPTASRGVRWTWAHGRTLLAVSAAVDGILPFVAILRNQDVGDTLPLALVRTAVAAYFLVYILGARRVRDTFASFPPPLLTTEK